MSNKRLWKDGEKVKLNSGGPKMTVVGTDKTGLVLCKWKTLTNKSQTYSFPAVCLRVA